MANEGIKIKDISVFNTPSKFTDNLKFEITFESLDDYEDDIEWKLTYVGSVDSESYDQVLDSVLVGPIPKGISKFVLETPSPDWKKMPKKDVLGVTILFVSCLLKDEEFIRIGYYVNNEYDDPNIIQKIPNDSEGIEVDDEDDGEPERTEVTDGIDVDNKRNEIVDNDIKKTNNENTVPDGPPVKKPKIDDELEKDTSTAETSKAKIKDDSDTNKENKDTSQKIEVPFPKGFSVDKVKRTIFADRPRITYIKI